MDEIKYEEVVDFVKKKNGNYSVTVKTITRSEIFAVDANHLFLMTVCIIRKQTHQNVLKWLRNRRHMTSLRDR